MKKIEIDEYKFKDKINKAYNQGANTIIGFILLGLTFWLASLPSSGFWKVVVGLCGFIVIFIFFDWSRKHYGEN